MERRLSPKLERNIELLTDGAKLAIVLCANAFRFGGNWGYIRSTREEYALQLEVLKQEKPNVKLYKVSNGALVVCREDFLAYNVNAVVPNAIGRPFVEKAKERREEEKVKLQKYLKKVANGEALGVEKKKDFYEVTIGIYSVNDTNLIKINGVDYPAYKLSLVETLEYANQLSKAGKRVYARAVKDDGTEVFDLVARLATNSKGVNALFRGLEIAESNTGVFLTLRIV